MAEQIQPQQSETNAGDEYIANRRLARVYAEALLNVAEKRGQTEAVGEELGELVQDVLLSHPEIEQLFASRAIRRTRKEPMLRDALAGKVSETLFNFILVLNERDRLELLRPVYLIYRDLLDERAKRVRVQVRTAAPLNDDEQRKLRETLQRALHQEPVLDVRVDPELLGG